MYRLATIIIRWEWLLLLCLLPLLLLPPGLTAAGLLVLPLLWLLRRASSGRFLVRTPYDLAILLLALMVLASLFVTFNVRLSLPKIAGASLSIALFYAAVAYTRQQPGNLWRLLAIFLAVASAMSLAGVAFVAWPPPFTFFNTFREWLPPALAVMPGTTAGTVNANELAGILTWLLPLLIAIASGILAPLWRQKPLLLILVATGNVVAAALLLASHSRSAWLALAITLLAMAAISYRHWRWVLLAAVPATLISLLYFNGAQHLFAAGPDQPIDLAGRLEVWPRALMALADFPLTGMGMNGFRQAAPALYPFTHLPADIDVAHAHNHLLQAGLDLGLPGLVAYLALWAISAALLWQSWQRTTAPAQRALITGLSGSMTAGWIFGIFDAIAIGARPGFLWWLLLALIVAVHDDVRRET